MGGIQSANTGLDPHGELIPGVQINGARKMVMPPLAVAVKAYCTTWIIENFGPGVIRMFGKKGTIS